MTEVPYTYLLCISEYWYHKFWLDEYTGCGSRVGYQSGKLYRNLFRTLEWKQDWRHLYEKEFFDD